MTNDPEKIRIIGRWLADLVDLTSPGRDPLSDRKMALYTQQLADVFPSSAFTQGSLRAAVFEQQYFPAFDVLRSRVDDWWRDNQPRRMAIGSDNNPRLDAMDHYWVSFFHRRRAELLAEPGAPLRIANLASLVRQQSPKAWMVVSGERGDEQSDATPEQRAHVHAVVEGLGNNQSRRL